jgi:hypothetical protein
MQVLAQEIEQRESRVIDLDRPFHPVHGQVRRDAHAVFPEQRWLCARSCGARAIEYPG